ncbi:Ethanolamine kinase 2 [Sarcoptes scabiei]|uniref:ethanolamine kinase n=1 Tax=Sarcoptes scabiei TaxID=52283 RepID=A0A834R5S6_SARSC|nr:Ethanolamine kinase 2 [Sarcoptes scabiei]UXI17941.1 cap-specific mRNA (nucleoside-2'-O-)-methyltransferase 2 [Sarcoptes scabiei]
MDDSLPKFNFKITEDRLNDGARELISRIKPEWPINKLNFKVFTDGITNRLIGVYHHNQTDGNHHNREMILIRIYGENTDLFIDRNIECRNMRIMYKHGMSAPIYATFLNGICYGYSPGTVLDSEMIRDSRISSLIAENMAQMHTLKPLILCGENSNSNHFNPSDDNNINGNKNIHHHATMCSPQPCLFKDLQRFLSLINKSALKNRNQIARKFETLINLNRLQDEIDFLREILLNLRSPIVFCHNDLLLKNIVYDSERKNVTFIDFEYSDYNFQAYDIANHFCEFCGLDSFDPEMYPDEEFQLQWLRTYLRKWYSLNKIQTDDFDQSKFSDDVRKLHGAVERFAMAANFYWGVWAIIQSSYSSIDFNYVSFAFNRLEEYFRRKNRFIKSYQKDQDHRHQNNHHNQ